MSILYIVIYKDFYELLISLIFFLDKTSPDIAIRYPGTVHIPTSFNYTNYQSIITLVIIYPPLQC